MNPYKITCSSTVDIAPSFLKEQQISYLPFYFQLHNQEHADDFGQHISFEQFYKAIREGALPTTSQNNPDAYYQFFESFLKEGYDILHLAFSSGLSGDYQSACIAKDLLEEHYPTQKIAVIDSLAASSGYGLLLTKLVDKKKLGYSLVDLTAYALDTRLSIQHWFFSSDLSHYKRGGRISSTSAAIGGMLSICPVMTMDHTGHLVPKQKARGKKKALRLLVENMQQSIDTLPYEGRCFISHSDCKEDAIQLRTLLEQTFPTLNGKINVYSIGTVIGSHTGPGTVALFFEGIKRN